MAPNGKGFTRGLLIGGLLGAGVALLYAPKSGKDLRSDMGRKVTGWKKGMKKTSDGLLEEARETVGAVAEAVAGHKGENTRESTRGAKEIASKSRSH